MGKHDAVRPLPYPHEDDEVAITAVPMKPAKLSWETLPKYLGNAKKAIIQVTGLLSALLALGFLPEPYSTWVTTAIAIATTVLHYVTANDPPPVEPDEKWGSSAH